MAFKFNPFTGQLDIVGGGAAGVAPSSGSAFTGGTDKRVLFDDAGTFGEAAAFTFDKTTGLLTTTKLTLGGAAIGSNALAVTGTGVFSSTLATSGNLVQASNSGGVYLGTANDVVLARDAANTLAQRNGTNAQTFNLYNSYTDASNYSRLAFYWSGNYAILEPQKAGSGVVSGFDFRNSGDTYFAGTSVVFRSAALNTWWTMNTSGHFIAGVDNTYDIGASGANRPRNVHVANSILVGNNYGWASGTRLIYGGYDGAFFITDSGFSGLARLQFAGNSSAFPMFKRAGTAIQVRLADDSDDAPLTVSTVKTKTYTVSTLPSASVAGVGARAFVTDASVTTFGMATVGGGTNYVPVYVGAGPAWFTG